MELAPVILFVYNRVEHTRRAISSLLANELAGESELFIYSDAPRDRKAEESVLEVRSYLRTIRGFRDVSIIENKVNLGPAKAIISGVTEIIGRYGKVIVLEDDLLVSPYFLKFMNDALRLYENEDRVISVCGYMYPAKIEKQHTLFLRVPDTWGWATWKRGWDLFESDGKKLMTELTAKKMMRRFTLDGAFGFEKMLRQQIEGKRDSWGIRWTASAVLSGRLSLYPARSLVNNIGFDKSGSHCGYIDGYNTQVSQGPVDVSSIPVSESEEAVRAVRKFCKVRRLKSIVNMILK